MSYTPPKKEEIDALKAEILKDQQTLDEMEKRLPVLVESLDAKFIAEIDKNIAQEDETALDTASPSQSWQILKKYYTQLVDAQVAQAREKIEESEENLYRKKLIFEGKSLEFEFGDTNKDIDLNAFNLWINKKVPPEDFEEAHRASNGDKKAFLSYMLKKYKATLQSKEEPKAEEKKEAVLPTNLSNVAGESGNVYRGDEDKSLSDFALSSGVGR
jgi:hypothetical protein